MNTFTLQPGEKLIISDPHVVWMKSGLDRVPGQVKLTDKRIVFIKDANPFAVFLLFLVKSMRAQVELEYPLNKIKSITAVDLMGEKRMTIDPGNERPKEFISMKADSFAKEVNRLNQTV